MAELEIGYDISAGVPLPELNVQKFLRGGGTLEQLKETRGINAVRHNTLPLYIINYDMIDSPKSDSIVRECRQLVLEDGTWDVVNKSYSRFFNLGEMQEEFEKFDWKSCVGSSKEDGSIMSLFRYEGEWFIITRGSWANGYMIDNKTTWAEMFHSILPMEKIKSLNLDPTLCYVFEMCSFVNKVVRKYPTPTLYLLTIFDKNTHQELSKIESDTVAHFMDVKRPEFYKFNSQAEVEALLKEKEETDPTWEGFVLKDGNGLRFKAKTRTYFSLHQMHANGNIFLPKYLVPWALKEDPAELLVYFPETEPYLKPVKDKIDSAWSSLKSTWEENWSIGLNDGKDGQKKFALTVKSNSFSSILFRLRQQKGAAQSIDDLKMEWRASEELIVKRLFE